MSRDTLGIPDMESADWSQMGSVTSARFEARSRLFLPLGSRDGRRVRWSALARRAGMELQADLSLGALAAAVGENTEDLRASSGTVDRATLATLLGVLGREIDAEWVTVVLWMVYADLERLADLHPGLTLSSIPLVPGGDRWHDGAHVSARIPVPLLKCFARDDGIRFPSAVYPPDIGFFLATPGYSDSVYVSASRVVTQRLAEQGLDLCDVRASALLPAGTHVG